MNLSSCKTTRLERLLLAILALIFIALPGCVMMRDVASEVGFTVWRDIGMPDVRGRKHYQDQLSQERKHRDEFQVNKSAEALDWLLTNRIHNGLREDEVSAILGEPGVHEYLDRDYKAGSNYLQTDSAYRWGPDENGRAIVLFFRDGHLVHFNPSEVRKTPKIDP